ncbi:MAG: tryptophan-rich sensory protein, partial [Clostridia bacterium]|nr:tryptophan-rich sensory protein [Clostridia bacterium]
VAFVWLLGLIALTVYMISKFRSIDRTSGSLQIPYLVWLLFAAYLNMGVYLLNR